MYFIHVLAGIEPAIPSHLAYSIETKALSYIHILRKGMFQIASVKDERERKRERKRGRERRGGGEEKR